MFALQEYLCTHSLQELEDEFGVTTTVVGHKASFNYSQINSPKAAKVVVQSRGTILSTLDGEPFPTEGVVGFTLVLARPFDRFFNLGEANAEVDWASTKFFEKLDGTLIIVYYDLHQGRWCIATRKQPEASIPLPDLPQYTFSSLFKEVVGQPDLDKWLGRVPFEYTLCFELCTRHNRVVVDYPESFATLLTMRHNLTGEELSEHSLLIQAEGLGTTIPEKHALTQEILFEFVNDQAPTEHEGVVAVDAQFNRVKIKNISYVAYSKIKGSLSDRAQKGNKRGILEVVLAGKDDDVITILHDEDKEAMLSLKDKLVKLNKKYVDVFNSVPVNSSDKEYSLELQAKAYPLWISPLFAMWRRGHKDFFGFIDSKQENGRWSNSFLDKVLQELGY